MPMRPFTSLIKPAGRSLAGHLGRLRDALAAGWRAAGWWLRGQPGRRPLLTALGVGLAAGAVALSPGPLAGLVGTARGLVALADAARCGVSALAGGLGP